MHRESMEDLPMTRSIAVTTILVFATIAPVYAQDTQPCTAPEYRQFDFWIGEWVVRNADRQVVGRNVIEKRFNGCVLHEHWTGARGNTGESFNTWDARRGVWHQTWVDGSGTLLLLEGGLVDGAMVLGQTGTGRDGNPVTHRITWTPLEDGRVRQHWQASRDGGESWNAVFDGYYSKVE